MTPRDPEATKARIFRAATAEFAAYGVAGARIDRIAEHAQANKQLIYAYFGDKQQLFDHVLEQAMADLAASVSHAIDDLDRWTDEHVEFHRKHPEVMRLLLWESLERGIDGAHYTPGRTERYGLKLSKVDEAQQAGVVRRDMPAGYFLLLLSGLINYPFAVPQLQRLLFPGGGEGREADGTSAPAFSEEQLQAWTRDAVRRLAAAPELQGAAERDEGDEGEGEGD